jgi:uncharacterized membrane protein HdeD (DUF308 family)
MKSHEKLYKHWYLLTLRGILLIILGVFAFVAPGYEGKIRFIKIFEIFVLASGLLIIQSAIINRHHANWQWMLLGGLLDFFFGFMLWLVPEISSGTVPLVLAIWFLYTGIIQGVESLVLIHENVKNWWFEFISGLFSFIMAFILIALRMHDRKEILLLLGIMASIYGVFNVVSSLILFEPED